MLLYNSRLRLFLSKVKSTWMGPCFVQATYLSEAMKIRFEDKNFVVNKARIKKYFPGVSVPIFGKLEEDIRVKNPSQAKMGVNEH